MKNRPDLKMILRTIMPSILSLGLLIYLCFGLFLPGYRQGLMQERRVALADLAQTAQGLLDHLDQEVESGNLSLEEAQAEGARRIQGLRYGPELKDYFWITDMEPRMIMHPYVEELTGQYLGDFYGPNGVSLFVEFSRIVEEHGQGYLEYSWQWKDDPVRVERKLSYVKLFEPWGWVLGTGLYIEDMHAQIARTSRNLLLFSVAVVIIVMGLSIYSIRRTLVISRRQREMLQALSESQQNLSMHLQQTPLGIIEWDPALRVKKWNPAAERIFGHDPQSAVGLHAGDLLCSGDSGKEAGKALEQMLAMEENTRREVRCTTADGRIITCDWFDTPLKNAEGEIVGIASFVDDITELIHAGQEKDRLKAQLNHSKKMEAIGSMAGGIAHDFNNNLFTVIGFSEMALMELEEGSRAGFCMDQVIIACNRAAQLVEQILNFSRYTEECDGALMVAPVIKESVKFFESAMSSDIEIKRNIDPAAGMVWADPGKIQQIFNDLCINAYHAMEDKGGVLEVVLDRIKGPKSYPADPLVTSWIRLIVSDTGCGMDEETLERIFEPYYTTKSPGKGTGLGLSLVHTLVEGLGGRVDVESAPGEGSCFTVLFPEHCENATDRDEDAESLPSVDPGKGILLVDPDISVLRLMEISLKNEGFRVQAFSEGKRALQTFMESTDDYDVLVVDPSMPVMDGCQLAMQVREKRPDMQVIFCVESPEDLESKDFSGASGEAFIRKPILIDDLIAKVNEFATTPGGEDPRCRVS